MSEFTANDGKPTRISKRQERSDNGIDGNKLFVDDTSGKAKRVIV